MESTTYPDLTLGRFGWDLYADTSQHNGSWGALAVTSDAVVSLTAAVGSNWTSVSVPAGMVIPIPFTSITLASGTVLCARES